MTAQTLIAMALADIGNTDPDPTQFATGLNHLNLLLSSFAWWDADDQPIYEISALANTINLPPYYLEILELQLASREGFYYNLPANRLAILEGKVKQLTDRLVYRRQHGGSMAPTTFVV